MQLLTALGVALYSIGPQPESGTVWTTALEIAEELGDIEARIDSPVRFTKIYYT